MQSEIGLLHFWQQGDLLTHSVAILLLLMSIASWSLTVTRFIQQLRFNRTMETVLTSFWAATSITLALDEIKQKDKTGVFAGLAQAGVLASQAHQNHAERGIGAGVSLSETLTRALRNQIVRSQVGIESGLTFLASVGATAPFIGLFGTVWGIYHALVALSGSTQVVLDKVAGPVGEALIMTAAGLFVAIPAVLAYNA
ncbi:MAG: MotA/TolQ/ExbB proton channel family protein, partial [Rhodocyclaceae bacterium]|nr:MotA/TolQ/ExbB proton channel family protein [Rhodocyclaceae bacterium]